jgi:hypothetical protein
MVSPMPCNKVICHYRNALSMHTVYGRPCYLCEFTQHCEVEVKYLKGLGHQMDFEFLKCFQTFSIEINPFLPVNAIKSWLIMLLALFCQFPLIKGRVYFNNDE